MTDLWDRMQALWDGAKAGKSKTRAHFVLDSTRCDEALGVPFEPRQQYLQIVMNEMFLANSREWFVKYAPMAVVTTTYLYNKSQQTSPFVVGPSTLGNQTPVPEGFMFRNSPVTSLHPYQGGALTLTVMFHAVQHQNNADVVLKALEGIASVADPMTPSINFSSYLKIADKVMDGVELMLGLQETIPLVGYQLTINPTINQKLAPTHLVLIDEDEQKLDQSKFWVKKSRLHFGDNIDDAEPYRDCDFVLLQIAQGTRRSDEHTLAFYPLWEKTRDLAMQSSNNHFWSEAKAHFNTLKRELIGSPDLTKPDYDRFRTDYLEELSKLRKEAVAEALRSSGSGGMPDEEAEMQEIGARLDELDEL